MFALFNIIACGDVQQKIPVNSIADEPYYQNPLLLTTAWRLPVAATFKESFEYQVNAAFCGPATVVNVFRSLDIESPYTQNTLFEKADIWYWKARLMGLTLDEMAQLMRVNSDFEIIIRRNLSKTEFRDYLRKSNDPDYRLIINFYREPLFGVNVGHHSPIGGYLEKQDLVFVLDVLKNYRPFLVPVDRLFEAMDTIDAETKKKRGLLLIHNPLWE
jgi:hypothetical protein